MQRLVTIEAILFFGLSLGVLAKHFISVVIGFV